MAGNFKFELVSPERVLVSEDASQVVVPGADGEFTVLAGHAPLIATLRPGTLVVKLASGERRVYVRGGIAEVEPDSLTILAQQLIDLDGSARASDIAAEIKAVEGILAGKPDEADRMLAEASLNHLKTLAA